MISVIVIVFMVIFMIAFYAIATIFEMTAKSFNKEDEESIMEFEQRIPKWIRWICGIHE